MNIPLPIPKPAPWTTILDMVDSSKVAMFARFDRIGVRTFVTILEYEHFTPDTPMNRLYQLPLLKRCELPWFLVIIPHAYLDVADAVAERVGLNRVPGEPREFAGDKSVDHFPPGLTNIFTLVNVLGHFAYDCDPSVRAAAYAAEDETVKRIVTEHYMQVMNKPGA